MNEKIKQAQETLLKLSSLALKYLINNFNYKNEEYLKLKQEIGNLTDKLRLTLDDFDRYHESQQDLITGKDEYIAKLCNDRAELKAELKEIKDILAEYGFELKDFREACLLLRQWRNENLCWVDYEKQKAELTELKEFAKVISISVEVNEFGSTDAFYNTANVITKDTIVNEDVTLVKKVVEKYGKN